MEEAWEYPALRRISVALFWAKYVAPFSGLLAQLIWRGHFLVLGLVLFAFCGFLSWCFAIPAAGRLGRKRQRAVILNAALWFVATIAIGMAITAPPLWR